MAITRKKATKRILAAVLAVILALPVTYWADEEADKGLRAWYDRLYDEAFDNGKCNIPKDTMPFGYSAYTLVWKAILTKTPTVADVLWPRPDFKKRIPVEEFDMYYYGCGIDDDTVIVIDGTRKESK